MNSNSKRPDSDRVENTEPVVTSSSSAVSCVVHRFQSHRRSRCPYCDLEAGVYLAIGSRDNASALADIIRDQNRGVAETLDHLADNFDRLGEIIQTINEIKEATI